MSTNQKDKISAKEKKVLERIFAAEIENRLPAQFAKSRNLTLDMLEDRGMIVKLEMTLGGRFPVRIEGWGLTNYGRIVYCGSC